MKHNDAFSLYRLVVEAIKVVIIRAKLPLELMLNPFIGVVKHDVGTVVGVNHHPINSKPRDFGLDDQHILVWSLNTFKVFVGKRNR